MTRPLARRTLLQAGLAMGITLLAPVARACEFCSTTLRFTQPWTRATAEGATFAIVCITFDEVTVTDRLIKVETPVASGAEMGGAGAGPVVDFVIPEGKESVLSETGTFIKLVGLTQPLEVGRTFPFRLVFEKGGVVEADLDVAYAQAD